MIVCIAEKPSVARDIADVLGAKDKKDGYIEGNGYQVTWTFGHLCTLKEPHEYTPNWKSWSLGSLPMVPPRFGIKLISNPTYERQFHVIENLMQHADMIINCGDAGQEGELIQRWVMQKAGARCPVKRLWISSLTEEAIREGFAKLRDASDFQPLYEAGLSRAIGDWLLGMNHPPVHHEVRAEPAGTFHRACADAYARAHRKPTARNTELRSQAILGTEDGVSRHHFLRHSPQER